MYSGAQFFYEILEFVKVGKSAEKIACLLLLLLLQDWSDVTNTIKHLTKL